MERKEQEFMEDIFSYWKQLGSLFITENGLLIDIPLENYLMLKAISILANCKYCYFFVLFIIFHLVN
jgi:hypothetical protein